MRMILTVRMKNQPKFSVTANWPMWNQSPTLLGKRIQTAISKMMSKIEVVKTGGFITNCLLSSNFLNMSYTLFVNNYNPVL